MLGKALGEKAAFPECLVLALGKEPEPLPRASGKALREEFLFVLFFLPNFFCEAFPHYLKLPVQIWDNFDFFLLYFVSFFCFVEFFAYFKFELQTHEIMEFGDSKNYINDIWCMLRPYPGTRMKFRASC